MDLNQKHIARLLFQNSLLKASGNEFEDLFTRIMHASRPDFRQVKPQGRLGDLKNDGFEPTYGRYFQVYGPEDLGKREHQALDKLEQDFAGVQAHWATTYPAGIREFYFVLNDRCRGSVFPSVLHALERIRQDHGLERCEPFLTKHLEDELFSLPDDQITAIIGFLPDPESIPRLDFTLLNEVIRHVLEHPVDKMQPGDLDVPDFEEKIQFNGLGATTAHWLTTAYYQRAAVEEFFAANSDFARQHVREILNGYYLEVIDALPNGTETQGITIGDQRFMEILRRITPETENRRKKKELQEAGLAIMALFFESCDIFKNPEG